MNEANKLQVIIVGSGLAGLTAARILREHHHVTVYERGDSSVATGGQGIIILPNGVKILESVGFDNTRACGVPIYGIRTYDKASNVLEDAEMHLKERFGADCLALKRSDFRDELLRLATAPSAELGISGDPARMLFKTPVVDLEAEEGVVELSDGSKVTADVVVVADGVHSSLRSTILTSNSNFHSTANESTSYTPQTIGLTCYRLAVSHTDALAALGPDTPLPCWWDRTTSQNRSSIIYGGDGSPRVVTVYPLRDYDMFNISCIVRTEEGTEEADSWHADGDRKELLRHFGDFEEGLVKMLSFVPSELKIWSLRSLPPLPTWTSGRSILIGDAAHAMTPMQGQGANMSIEDAESLRLLIPGTKREDVPDILRKAESVRRPRVKRVQKQTRQAESLQGVAERAVRGLEENCGYGGIWEAVGEMEKGV